MFLQDLGGRIRERRERLGLKQLDLANALQVTPQAVSKWERGENAPDIATLGPLALLLDVSTDWILGRQASMGDVFEATVFVSSISGYTARAGGLELGDLAAWTNGFLSCVTESLLRHGGVPVKYLGDGLLGFFAGHDHRARALRAAESARATVTDPLVIGLSSGPVHLTSIGHPSYARSDILGSTVNRAFRVLAWAAGSGPNRIVAAVEVLEGLIEHCELGVTARVALQGFAEPVLLHELIGLRLER